MTILFHMEKDPCYFLSNFYPYKAKDPLFSLNIDGMTFSTTEHLYHYIKVQILNPSATTEYAEIIRNINTPSKAKYLGHQKTSIQYPWMKPLRESVLKYKDVIRYSDEEWITHRDTVMLDITIEKFRQNPHLYKMLQNTKPHALGENTKDYWGIYGGNALGRTLEKVRDMDISLYEPLTLKKYF